MWEYLHSRLCLLVEYLHSRLCLLVCFTYATTKHVAPARVDILMRPFSSRDPHLEHLPLVLPFFHVCAPKMSVFTLLENLLAYYVNDAASGTLNTTLPGRLSASTLAPMSFYYFVYFVYLLFVLLVELHFNWQGK